MLECAGHQAVKQYAPTVLERGWTLAIISTGALADTDFEQHLVALTQRHHSQLIPLTGAVAGLDGLRAARSNITQVTYQSRKSPQVGAMARLSVMSICHK